jgi:ribosome biogenesis GTPase A
MNIARQEAAKRMETVDVIIELLDARMPEASSNPMITELRLHRQRPCLKVLNKADLADPAAWPGCQGAKSLSAPGPASQ